MFSFKKFLAGFSFCLSGNSDKKYPLLNIFFNKSVKVIANSSAI
jgi:hypothetical protein